MQADPRVITQLNERMGKDGAIQFSEGLGGLTLIHLHGQGAHAGSAAAVYQHGAHVVHYQPAGHQPVLFMSDASAFAEGQPIRGGIPVCLPWFGPHADDADKPAHGFARTRGWKVRETGLTDDGDPYVTLVLKHDSATLAIWPHHFVAIMTITLNDALHVVLEMKNLNVPSGDGSDAFTFEAALHSYFAVSDVRQIAVDGLAGVTYIDKMDQAKRKQQGDEPFRFTQETDRVYLATDATCSFADEAWGRRIVVEKSGSKSTVVWNPWIDKAARMPDFGDEEWPGMVCIETANAADDAITLRSEESHTMSLTLRAQQM